MPQEKRVIEHHEDAQVTSRPKRRRVAPKRFVEEFHEEITITLTSGKDGAESGEVVDDAEDIGSDLEADFADWMEDNTEQILRFATEHGLDIDQAAFRLYGNDGDSEEGSDGDGDEADLDDYESSFINDDSEEEESESDEELESEKSEETETTTSDTDKENQEN